MGILAGLSALAVLGGMAVEAPERLSERQTIVTVDVRTPADQDERLASLRARYAEAVNAADAAALASLYAPDALVVVADGIVLRGAAEIGRYFQNAFGARVQGAQVTLRPERFSVERGVASETGAFSEARTGTSVPVTGVYVTIYTQDAAGEWRIAMEVRTRGRDKQVVHW